MARQELLVMHGNRMDKPVPVLEQRPNKGIGYLWSPQVV